MKVQSLLALRRKNLDQAIEVLLDKESISGDDFRMLIYPESNEKNCA